MFNYAKFMDSDLVYTPEILDISHTKDQKRYRTLLAKSGVMVFDTIKNQLTELLLINNPTFGAKDIENQDLVAKHINCDLEEYGNWVYYPWSNRLIHILPEEEYIEVRTNRNRNKITVEEQKILRKKTIGVAGLSVGRSVALTLANERIVGNIVLADFDKIELSNLNRLKVNISDLGLNKSISAAREISELDPYIKVFCLHDGLNIENLDAFFNSQIGRLDLFIEECDDLEIKLKSRIAARKLGIPVVMEASDRCLVDIERYDLEPNYPILHGIIDEEDIENVSSLKTFEEKLKLMSKIVDVNNISERMKASLPEIGRTLRTWPQLASDVTYGAGVVALICRLILLGEISISTRSYFEVDSSNFGK